jgi:hypothetical protein
MSAQFATPDPATSTSTALVVCTIAMLAGALLLVVGYWTIIFLRVVVLVVLERLRKNKR